MTKRLPEYFFSLLKQGKQPEEQERLFKAWVAQASEEEMQELLKLYGDHFEQQAEEIRPEDQALILKIEKSIDRAELQKKPIQVRIWPDFKKALAAAAVLFCVLTSIYLFENGGFKKPAVDKVASAKIVPGKEQATLTLADGSTIILNSAKAGQLARQGGVKIYKSKSGQLIYDASGMQSAEQSQGYNTISTPRGGQYQLVLPDGTKVWLNAASSLKFPAHFSGNRRQVALSGEAYFEVTHDKSHPFIVDVNDTQVQVLGTHFNIMGYADEKATKTTLLEGSVKIIKGSDQQMLVPGEQACVKDNIKVSKVNVAESIEWKNGNFNFAHEKLESIMRKISRWYDVDIEYQDKITEEGFVGTLPRSKNISEVLNYLELTELVHFKVKERRIIVMP